MTRVTFEEGLQTLPSWSPDGRSIAYSSDQSDNFDIWVQPLGGGRAVQVTTDAGEVAAETYVIPNPGGPFKPTAAYVRPILAGARDLGLPAVYVAALDALISESRIGYSRSSGGSQGLSR